MKCASFLYSGLMLVQPPLSECKTTIVEFFIESPAIHLQWNPVNRRLAPECPSIVRYCVSHRCCSDTNWQSTTCTVNTSIELQVDLKGCDIENQAVFSVQVEGSNHSSSVTVDLENNTGTCYNRYYIKITVIVMGFPSQHYARKSKC